MNLMVAPEFLVLTLLLLAGNLFIEFPRRGSSRTRWIRYALRNSLLLALVWVLFLFATEHRQITQQVLADTVSVQRWIFGLSFLFSTLLLWRYVSRKRHTIRKLTLPWMVYTLLVAVLADALTGSFRMYLRQMTLIHQHGGPDYASHLFATLAASLDVTSVTFLYNLLSLLLFIGGLILLRTRSMRVLVIGEGLLVSLIVMTGLYVQVFNMTLNLEVGYAVDILSQDFTILSFYQFTLLFSMLLAFLLAMISALRLMRLNHLAILAAERRKADEVRRNMIAQQRELERLVKLRTRELAEEHERSERLLRNILPEVIAERLKEDESSIAENFAGTTVIFADIVGFTPLSATLSPPDLVQMLNRVFSEFDDLAEKHGLEKIKTIGDAYMVTAGLPQPREDHALIACRMALDMLAVMERMEPVEGRKLEIRIGMNSGPVVAGVIGKKKFAYDLWGDVVNTAARMEAFGIASRIQLTDATRKLIADEYHVESRGIVEVKGKGPMELYLLGSERERSSEGGSNPRVAAGEGE